MNKGVVVKSTGSWYNVKLDNGSMLQCRIKGKFRLEGLKLTNPVAVGDEVIVDKEESGDVDTGTIKEILPRRNYVIRQSPRKKHNVHLLASNVDHALLIVTMVNPQLKQGFIDRFLLMTEPYQIPVTVIFNKCDIYGEDDLLQFEYFKAIYESIGYRVILASAFTKEGLKSIKETLKDKTTLIAGQSGVGKSTLVNAIEPRLDLRTGDISDYTGKGQHTTTFAELHDLTLGGSIIDTPGIKTLGFNHLEVMDIAHNFREFFILSEDCKFRDCTHRNEPKCAVKAALEEGRISALRYNNYLQLLEEVEDQNYWERHSDM
jgi:ribosome biogenesis GTPase